MTIRPGIRNRWKAWRRISVHPGAYPSCQHTTGTEACCCGTHGWRNTCGKRIGVVRFVLVGVCPEHEQEQK